MPKDVDVEQPKDLDQNLKKELDQNDKKEHETIIKQVEAEYKLGLSFMEPRLNEWLTRLSLYNNQRRDKMAIGDSLMFEVHQTILASLYYDQLQSEWLGRDEGDDEKVENLNALMLFDNEAMEKDQLDYDWDWDATFFGYGLVLMADFDKETLTPVPEIMDPMCTIRDPRGISINGDKRRRGMTRFMGRKIWLTKKQMESNPSYVNFNSLIYKEENSDLVFQNFRNARNDAQGYQNIEKLDRMPNDSSNRDFCLLEWFTYWQGEPHIITLADNMKTIVRLQKLEHRGFPIVKRTIFPASHSFNGASVPDFTEDKQRGRASVRNAALNSIRAGQNQMYFYDRFKVKNPEDLANMASYKHIPVDGNPANIVAPIQREAVKAEVQWILNEMEASAQKATATPDIKQGIMPSGDVKATGLALADKNTDTRYGLAAKVFGWSEKRFWKEWYGLYKTYFADDVYEKVVRLRGALATQYRKIGRKDIVLSGADPDVYVDSKVVAESKKAMELKIYGELLSQVSNPSGRRYLVKKIARKSGLRSEEIDLIEPATVDELEATDENEKLSQDKPAEVKMTQDHVVHLQIHSRAEDTSATRAHVKAHKLAMMIARENPELLPNPMADKFSGVEETPVQRPKMNYDQPKAIQTV